MTLKKFVANLNKIMQEYPETAKYKVITAIDDEGKGYNPVEYIPSLGYYNDESQDFFNENDGYEESANAICVN